MVGGTSTNDGVEDVLGSLYRDPQAISKLLGGCLAVICIPLLGLGLLALLGFISQTAVGTYQGKEHPMPPWRNLSALMHDGLRLLALLAAFIVPVVILGTVATSLVWVPILGWVLLVAELFLGLFVIGFFPFILVMFVRTNGFREDDDDAANVGADTVLNVWGALIVTVGLSVLTLALCVVGIIPGVFCGMASFGGVLGLIARKSESEQP